jgi:hypothetical protein
LNLFHGISALARQSQFTEVAESMIRGVDIGTYPGVAEAYCGIVGPGPLRLERAVVSWQIHRISDESKIIRNDEGFDTDLHLA